MIQRKKQSQMLEPIISVMHKTTLRIGALLLPFTRCHSPIWSIRRECKQWCNLTLESCSWCLNCKSLFAQSLWKQAKSILLARISKSHSNFSLILLLRQNANEIFLLGKKAGNGDCSYIKPCLNSPLQYQWTNGQQNADLYSMRIRTQPSYKTALDWLFSAVYHVGPCKIYFFKKIYIVIPSTWTSQIEI